MSEFDSLERGKFGMTFDNGTRISVAWTAMTYSENYDDDFEEVRARDNVRSLTAELMCTKDPTGKVVKRIVKIHGGNPAGYLTPEQVTRILNYASKIKPAQTSSSKQAGGK